MALTPKQERLRKLSVLRLLARHTGMFGMPWWPFEDELQRRRSAHPGLAEFAVLVICVSDDPVSRAAYGMILEYFYPQWREGAPVEALGLVVKRESREVREWRLAVLQRDGRQCTRCGSTKRLEAHHVVRWADSPFLRVDVANGQTLCKSCHYGVHRPGSLLPL